MSIVSLVLIDGLHPAAIEVGNCPNLKTFCRESAFTLAASSVMPSITLPCHTSIFHSVPPERHGILTNQWTPLARPLPGLIDQASAVGLRCAMFYNWEPLRDLSRPGSLTLSFCLNTSESDPTSDRIVAEEASHHLANGSFDFAFVYFGTVDAAGHDYGWLSPGYLAQLEMVDGYFGRLLEALPNEATILVQSDHGGHERNHGTASPDDMTIPWLIKGPAIRRGYQLTTPVSLLDTAPTLARCLNIPPHPKWEGWCVEEIFA